jgi:hypothetical protein
MRFIVGGEAFDITPEQVIDAMRGVESEPIRKHLVEIDGQKYPPKQVFATVTGRARTTFTTMEAQRVLRRLGFVCQQAGQLDRPAPSAVATSGDHGVGDELSVVPARFVALEAAVAGLQIRVSELERRAK